MAFSEADLVNEIARHERAIAGVKQSYDYARNPDKLTGADLPAVFHYPSNFEMEPGGHFNVWREGLVVRSVLFVVPREAMGGKLRYIENEAIPYGYKWRARFKDEAVLRSMSTVSGGHKFFLATGRYGAGGDLLTFGGVEFVGWVYEFRFAATG